jgi:hypothetical protein
VRVWRRYRNFLELDQALRAELYGEQENEFHLNWPILPPTKFCGNLDEEFVVNRQKQLQEYLNYILKVPRARESVAFEKFMRDSPIEEQNSTMPSGWFSQFVNDFSATINELTTGSIDSFAAICADTLGGVDADKKTPTQDLESTKNLRLDSVCQHAPSCTCARRSIVSKLGIQIDEVNHAYTDSEYCEGPLSPNARAA